MQTYERLTGGFDLTAFSSVRPIHDKLSIPVVKLFSPMDLPEFPYKMPVLNRLFTDAHYLFGLEDRLTGFDLVHTAETYYYYTQQCLDARRRGTVKKVIATVLENIPFNNEGVVGRSLFKSRAREELDHIIALTRKTRHALIAEGANPDKISVIGHYIDTKRFYPDSSHKPASATGGGREIRILFCGRLEINKGIYDLLDAAAIILHDPALGGYRIKFVIAGDGSQYRRMSRAETDMGIVPRIIHTQVPYDDMPGIYRSADIYVAPSKPSEYWEEQYNTTLLEAQASGLPIVTTDSGGISENVGDSALMIPPGHSRDLAAALKMLILEPKQRTALALKARKRAVRMHDISVGVRLLTDLYHRILAVSA